MNKNEIIEEWLDKEVFYASIQNHITPAQSVLDIGCGIRPQQYITPDLLICVEPHKEYVEILQKNLSNSNALIIPLDAKQALKALPAASVDTIFLIDVIEHMPKDVGWEVLKECERVARQQIVIFTPLGYMPQEIHAGQSDGWNLNGGEWQDHKSGWYPEDFPGWNIVGCKELHTTDFKGNPLDPAYGGFFAIKNITATNNQFNLLYSNAQLERATEFITALRTTFPQCLTQIINSEMAKSYLKCGLQACQTTTELFIELGKNRSKNEILELSKKEKETFLLAESQKYHQKIKDFAAQFHGTNSREQLILDKNTQLNQRESDLTIVEMDLKRRELIISEKETEIVNRQNELLVYEAELAKRESHLLNKLWSKIYKKLTSS